LCRRPRHNNDHVFLKGVDDHQSASCMRLAQIA
jgi:hypothetical protein